MAKEPKVYAVKKGLQTGIFYSWDECSKAVKGYSGAQYKSFKTLEEAHEYLEADNNSSKPDEAPKDTAVAYIDGSFNEATNEYGCGVVVFYQGNTKEFSKKNNNPDLATMRNVAGELMGAINSIKIAMSLGAKQINIYYDYEGIEQWAVGNWKTNKEGTKKYKAFIDSVKDKITIKFQKVKAHTGVEYNERADVLAKASLGIVDEKIISTPSKTPTSIATSDDNIDTQSEIYKFVDEYIKKHNDCEFFDILDMIYEDTDGEIDVSDDFIEKVYQRNVEQGNIKII